MLRVLAQPVLPGKFDQGLLRVPRAEVKAGRFKHESLQSDDAARMGLEDRIVGRDVLRRRELQVVRGAYDLAGLLERVLDLAGREQRGSCGILCGLVRLAPVQGKWQEGSWYHVGILVWTNESKPMIIDHSGVEGSYRPGLVSPSTTKHTG